MGTAIPTPRRAHGTCGPRRQPNPGRDCCRTHPCRGPLQAGIFQVPASVTFFHVVEAAEGDSALAQFLSILFTQNILLMTFNMISRATPRRQHSRGAVRLGERSPQVVRNHARSTVQPSRLAGSLGTSSASSSGRSCESQSSCSIGTEPALSTPRHSRAGFGNRRIEE